MDLADRIEGPWRRYAALAVGAALSLAVLLYQSDTQLIQGTVVRVFEFGATKWTAAYAWFAISCVLLLPQFLSSARVGRPEVVDVAITGFALFMAVSALWAPDHSAAWLSVGHIIMVLSVYALFRLLPQPGLVLILSAFAGFTTLGSLALQYLETPSAHAGLGNQNFAAETMILAAAIGAVMAVKLAKFWRIVLWSLAILAAFQVLFLSGTNLTLISVWLVLIYLPLAMGRTGLFWAMVMVSLVGAAAALVLAVGFNDALPDSFRDRFQTWGNVVFMISDAPWFGRGLRGLFHDLGEYTNRYLVAFSFLGSPAYVNLERQPTAAENEVLHVWVEFGAAGLVLLALALFILACRGLRMRSTSAAARWLPIPLLVVFGTALVSFPVQNASTAMPLTVYLAYFVAATSDRDGACSVSLFLRTLGPVIGLLIGLVGMASYFGEARAGFLASQAAARDQVSDARASCEYARLAAETSDAQPLIRLRAYTQCVVAGPQNWRALGLDAPTFDLLFAGAQSASPRSPLLIELRLKQLLSMQGLTLAVPDIEALLVDLKATTGDTMANADVLDAAFALQMGDLPRARASLDLAHSKVGEPTDENTVSNLENIESLEQSYLRLRRRATD